MIPFFSNNKNIILGERYIKLIRLEDFDWLSSSEKLIKKNIISENYALL